MHKANIFYVDDNARSRLLLASILREIGFNVIEVDDPVDALELLEGARFDLILLDYQMPGMTGAQLAQKIKKLFPEIPIVMISGHATLPERELTHVDAYCGEGTTLDELILTIHTLTPAPRAITPRVHVGNSSLWSSST